MIDIIPGWSSKFPASMDLVAGDVPLFEDTRVIWALNYLGGARGKMILELGPLEGGHTYMLSREGAAHITAIEANRTNFLKCLISREIMKIERVEFLFGNFVPWLKHTRQVFDIIWAAGVLYHMPDPAELIALIGQKTTAVHLWTHYVPDDENQALGDWAKHIFKREDRELNGRVIPYFLKAYGDAVNIAKYSGGIHKYSVWMKRADIILELRRAGFTKIEIGYEDTLHPHGPCFAIAAEK